MLVNSFGVAPKFLDVIWRSLLLLVMILAIFLTFDTGSPFIVSYGFVLFALWWRLTLINPGLPSCSKALLFFLTAVEAAVVLLELRPESI